MKNRLTIAGKSLTHLGRKIWARDIGVESQELHSTKPSHKDLQMSKAPSSASSELQNARKRRLYVEPRLEDLQSEMTKFKQERQDLVEALKNKRPDDAKFAPQRKRRTYVVARLVELQDEKRRLVAEKQTLRAMISTMKDAEEKK